MKLHVRPTQTLQTSKNLKNENNDTPFTIHSTPITRSKIMIAALNLDIRQPCEVCEVMAQPASANRCLFVKLIEHAVICVHA